MTKSEIARPLRFRVHTVFGILAGVSAYIALERPRLVFVATHLISRQCRGCFPCESRARSQRSPPFRQSQVNFQSFLDICIPRLAPLFSIPQRSKPRSKKHQATSHTTDQDTHTLDLRRGTKERFLIDEILAGMICREDFHQAIQGKYGEYKPTKARKAADGWGGHQ